MTTATAAAITRATMTDEAELSIQRRYAAIGGLWSIVDAVASRLPAARTTDPETSHKAADRNAPRRTSQAMRILSAYLEGPQTDEQASTIAKIPGGWKRCSDLRRLGYIEPTGETAVTSYGSEANVCRITALGRTVANGG
jgi:hypothetical protein